MAAREGSNGNWRENRKSVNGGIERIERGQEELKVTLAALDLRLVALDLRFTALSVRASLWGAAGGLVVTAIVLALARRFIG